MADVSNCRVCKKNLVGDVGNILITVAALFISYRGTPITATGGDARDAKTFFAKPATPSTTRIAVMRTG